MAILNDINSIIVPSASANFTAHTYSQVYAGANTTAVINGQLITLAASSLIPIKVTSISGGTGIALLGENIDNLTDGPNLGPIYV